MPELRWILIGFAIVLLATIYLWGRRSSVESSKHERSLPSSGSAEPYLGDAVPVEPVIAEPAERSFEEELQEVEQPAPQLAPTVYPRTIVREAEPAAPASTGAHEPWRGRVEPTLSDAELTEELPQDEPVVTAAAAASAAPVEPETPAPTLSSAEAPAPKRIERRKILALRLAATPLKLDGARLLETFQSESLQHGKYDIFHRLHDDGTSIFSVASMVEPGTFDLEKMPTTQYPGVTLFAQLPGPVPGMHALNELVACARRLQQSLGGTLQDDRGVPLTVHRIERLRQEVREFERPQNSANAARGVSPSKRQV